MNPIALLDSNILYSSTLRSFFMWLSAHELFRPKWSSNIQEEWTRSVHKDYPDIDKKMLTRTVHCMEKSNEDAMVEGFEHLFSKLPALPDLNDTHVLAAAIHCESDFLITLNLKDFPKKAAKAYRGKIIGPDEFVSRLIKDNKHGVIDALNHMHRAMKNPPMTLQELLKKLSICGLEKSGKSLSRLISN